MYALFRIVICKNASVGVASALGALIVLLGIYYFWRGMTLGEALSRSAPYLIGFFIGGTIGSALRSRKNKDTHQ